MDMTVTALQPQRRNPDLVNMHIDGEFSSAVAYVVITTEGVRTGDVITTEQLERLLAADERWKAKQAALSLLGVRARAEGELADRLRRKDFSDVAISFALEEIRRLGFLDDAAFAESWVRDRLRLRPRGTQALIHELGRKRVSADIARAAIERVMRAENVDDDALCMAAAEHWVAARARSSTRSEASAGEDHDRRIESRLSAFLARRGYRADAIRAAIDATLRSRRGN